MELIPSMEPNLGLEPILMVEPVPVLEPIPAVDLTPPTQTPTNLMLTQFQFQLQKKSEL